MRSMAGRWSDQDIAASLNRMGMPTGQGKTWTAHRVRVAAPGTWHPRLPLRREERRVVDIARSGRKARCQPSSSSQAHQGRRPGQRADHARRTSPDPCGRPRKRAGRCRAQAQRPPVSGRSRKSESQCFQTLEEGVHGQHSELRVRKPNPASMAAARRRRRSPSCAAWPAVGPIRTSPPR